METIEVVRPGSDVIIGGDVRARVIGVCIREDGYIEYQVTWWDGLTRKSEWVQLCEVSHDDSSLMKIGFLST